MVEKPAQGTAPSNLFINGRYILQPEIFDLIEQQERGAGNEIQITDAMQQLLKTQGFTGVKYDGEVFDCGSKIGFLAANSAFALDRPDMAADYLAELKRIISRAKCRNGAYSSGLLQSSHMAGESRL